MTRRVHVVGSSPRTGTTLLTELLAMGFEVEAVANHERSIFKAPHVRCETYLSKNPQDVCVVGRLLRHDPDLWVLHVVRDPRDVVVSRHDRDPESYWTHLGIWKSYHGAARRARGMPRFRSIRYEDLVADPDAVQDEIAGFLPFLKRRRPFSSFEHFAVPPPRAVEALGGVRPIDASSIGAWRRHKPRLAAQLARFGPIDRDLQELGYEGDASWRRELAGVEAHNGSSHLPEDVPLWVRGQRAVRRERRIWQYKRGSTPGAARSSKRKRTPRARPGPFALERIHADRVRLEFGTLGEGPAVLLLPGFGLPGTEEFAELGPALAAQGFRAIALNPRGVSRSRGALHEITLHDLAEDAAAVLRHVGSAAHVVGRGYGNRVARCLASDAPELVHSVALVAAGGLVSPSQNRLWGRGLSRRRKRWLRARQAQRRASENTPLHDWWDGGSAPMLVIQGLDDGIAPPENGRQLARKHPGRVRLVEIEGVGHRLLHDRSDVVVPEIVAFVARQQGALDASDASDE